jgi:hypothetical protein
MFNSFRMPSSSSSSSSFLDAEKKKETDKKKIQIAEPLDRPGHPVFSVFVWFWRLVRGSHAERFCVLPGPDAGPVPVSTGPVLTTL